MARENVIAKLRPWKCPICSYQRETARQLAQHIAMKWDKSHIDWRVEHGILPPHRPEDMPTVHRMIPEILRYLTIAEDKSWN
jgi:hypothetical protein